MNMITARNICKTYPRGREEVCALRGVDLDVIAGEFVSIVGPSGAGKTALMNILGCLDIPTSGTLAIHGTDVTKRPESELVKIRRKHIGFVFQQFFLIPTLTVAENTGLPLIFSGTPYDGKEIESVLEQVGLSHRKDHLPGQLSGGEMQRVAIARALVNNPRILLADEPTGNLDSVTADSIYRIFNELHAKGITVIIVTHNLELAKRAGRMITIRDGCVMKADHQC